MRTRATVLLPAGPKEAWGTIVDWEQQPRWMADAASVRVVSPHREGRRVRIAVRTRVLGVPLLDDVLEVTEWAPPRLLMMARLGFVRGRGEWRLEPEGTGTRFTWTEEIRIPIPLLGELALLLYRPIMRRLMRRSLDGLAAALR